MTVDDKVIHARLKALRTDVIEPEITKHRGRIVGRLVQLTSVVDAVKCAASIREVLRANYGQREPAQRNLSRFVDLLRLRACVC